MLEHEYIDKKDLKSYIITDDISEVVEYIESHAKES